MKRNKILRKNQKKKSLITSDRQKSTEIGPGRTATLVNHVTEMRSEGNVIIIGHVMREQTAVETTTHTTEVKKSVPIVAAKAPMNDSNASGMSESVSSARIGV